MDVEACARVIELLLSRDRRVPLAEISGRLGMLDPMKIVAQLDLLDGVVFLRSPPAGLSLTSDLREELGGTGTRSRPAMEQFEAQRIEFDCAGCGRKLRVRITLVGMGIRCPRCRTKYRSVQDGHGRIRLEREVRREQRQPAAARSNHEPSPYEVLGVPRGASIREIKRAYRRLMKQHHPDVVTQQDSERRQIAEERAKEINVAYETLLEDFEG